MVYRVSGRKLTVRVSPSRPLAFKSGTRRFKSGVFALVNWEDSAKAYFYAKKEIEENIKKRGGRSGYVYKEGFDLKKNFDGIKLFLSDELPNWKPALKGPKKVALSELLVHQPGVDLWRMLCFALDQNQLPDLFLQNCPPLFSLYNPNIGHVLSAGNHRALFALANNIEEINLSWVNIPGKAVEFLGGLRANLDYVKNTFGSQGILALAQSFIEQIL